MRITLPRCAAGLMLVLLSPISVPIKLVNLARCRVRRPAYRGTIEGDPLAYRGKQPILIAVWANWSSIWREATAGVVEQLKIRYLGRCEFAYVECVGRSVKKEYGVETVPVLILRHRGQEWARFVKTIEAGPVEQAIERCLASGESFFQD